MITSWQVVSAGTSGGVTATGTLCGLAAALLISLASLWVRLLPGKWLGISFLAAALGMFFDSLLGATVEKNHLLNNNGVNFLSTLLAAIVAVALV